VYNFFFVMTNSAMGRKYVVLGLAVCLFLSSFNEVSCQVRKTIIKQTVLYTYRT